MLWRKDSAVRPRFLVGSPGALGEVMARTEEGRKEGRRTGEEGRISKDGRRLITPRDIRSFASVRRKGITERKRERWRTLRVRVRELRARAHIETRRTPARNAKYIRRARNP